MRRAVWLYDIKAQLSRRSYIDFHQELWQGGVASNPCRTPSGRPRLAHSELDAKNKHRTVGQAPEHDTFGVILTSHATLYGDG